ncbi:MAG: hypothetical protein NC218_06410 [Acetobacter sp.]|nr:hypothetical protein [Acetobacter sp.]
MSHFLLTILLHLIPLVLLMIPFLLLFDVSLKSKKKPSPTPDMKELETRLNKLLENNHISAQINTLQKDLQTTKTNTVAAYIKLNKEDIRGFHLFQLVFSLIKNNAEDDKIIKILRHYLPSCATTHLYAILHSFKVFLNISSRDGKQKELLRDLNHNRVRTTLLYLEQKINQTLNFVPKAPPAMQQLIIDRAVVYGLVFAGFCEFYDNDATEKILRLAQMLSPEIFKYWHIIPKQNEQEYTAFKQHINTKVIAERLN